MQKAIKKREITIADIGKVCTINNVKMIQGSKFFILGDIRGEDAILMVSNIVLEVPKKNITLG